MNGVKVITFAFLCPTTEGEGAYCLWCGSCRRWRWCSRLSVLYLVNRWVIRPKSHGYVNGIGQLKVLDFGDLGHIFKVTGDITISNLDQKVLYLDKRRLAAPYLVNR